MILSIEILPNISYGSASGAGTYTSGTAVSITAVPLGNFSFSYWRYGDTNYTDNPRTLNVGSENVDVECFFYLSIEGYLKGKVGFDVDDSKFQSILLDRGITPGTDSEDVSVQDRDLLYADTLMIIATTPNVIAGTEKMGDWSSTGQSISVTDRDSFINAANSIYIKYGDDKYSSSITSKTNLW